MRTLIFGAKGQLGRDLEKRFGLEGEVRGLDLPMLDIGNPQDVAKAVAAFEPDLIINAAAYTDVEAAEDNPDTAFAINEQGARHVAEAAVRHGVPTVYYSTDFVFDGKKTSPYDVDDPVAPLNVYGASKVAGEIATRQAQPASFVIRTAWLYGPGGNHFVEKILRAAATRPELRVIDEETGSPTHTWSLAEATVALSRTQAYGTYHAVNEGCCSRYAFACAIVRQAGLSTNVIPCSAAAYPMKARRPAYAALSNAKLLQVTGFVMPNWETALAAYMKKCKTSVDK